MTPHKARKLCYILLAATVLLVMIGLAWKWNEGVVALAGLGGIGTVYCILMIFWRCPHCDRHLGRLSDMKYCPHCGKSLGGE